MTNDKERPQIPTELQGYIDEHLTRLEKHVTKMREALDTREAKNFVDNFSTMQLQERSILAGCQQIMQRCNFTEKDLMMKPLDEYR